MEIMVYLGILDTRKYFGSQKILSEITAIWLWISLEWELCSYFVVKMALWDIYFVLIFLIEVLNNVSCNFLGRGATFICHFFCLSAGLRVCVSALDKI